LGSELFLRKTTGLVRAWGFWDVFAANSWTNPFVGYYTYFVLLYAPFIPTGNLLIAVVLGIFLVLPQCLVYAMLVSTMPRAGGEYVWMSRIYRWPIVGYVLTMVAWVVTPLFWLAILAPAICGLYFQPIAVALGNMPLALWFMTRDGMFLGCVFYVAVGLVIMGAGMRWTGRMLKLGFSLGGIIAVLATIGILLMYKPTDFVNAYNAFHTQQFGMSDAYNGAINLVTQTWSTPIVNLWDWSPNAILSSLPLLGFTAFATSWHMWGAPMYGEVKGASEMKVSFWTMAGADLLNNALMIAYLLAWVALVGFPFYQSSNLLYGTFVWYGFDASSINNMMPLYPTPTLYIYLLTKSPILTIAICLAGIIFLSSMHPGPCAILPPVRVSFAMAYDRVLPASFARLSTSRRIPLVALGFFSAIALIFGWLYWYVPGFTTLTLMGTLLIIVSFMGTSLAGAILPFVRPDTWKESSASKYKIGNIPLITVAGVLAFAYFVYLCYLWLSDPIYGVSNLQSTEFFGIMYAAVIALYLVRKWQLQRHGMGIAKIFGEIPSE
jgi:APA family basic amino acid/polyamine antiporter